MTEDSNNWMCVGLLNSSYNFFLKKGDVLFFLIQV